MPLSRLNDTDADITVTYCANPGHPADCPGEVEQTLPPGAVLTYDSAADNGPDITAQLQAATEIEI